VSEPESKDALLETAIEVLNGRYLANGEFNAHLDAEEPVVIGASEYLRSAVLFWVDPEAYEVEKEVWQRNESELKHEKVLELIRASGLAALVEDLLQAVERNRVVPFVGAGLSRPLGMPLWGEALTQLLARMPDADATAIQPLIQSGKYLEAAQKLAAHNRVQTSHFIRTTYRAQQLKLHAGPMQHLPRFAKGCVVTTNFDDAIEKTYEARKLDFKAYMHGTQEHNFFARLVRGDRCILKLHGDAETDATHILTAEQYEQAYGQQPGFEFHKPLPKALRQIYISQSLLFMGCSLEQDWTMDLFQAACDGNGYQVPNHYAVVPAPADLQARQQKEARLLALNIQPIWYPDGDHGLVERLVDFIGDVAEKKIVFKA
jgi:hypothetical protein